MASPIRTLPARTASGRALPAPLAETLHSALGRHERHDPVRPRTGGPAGNALLTAWLGMVLLVGFFLEGLTLIDVRGLISWHIILGALLVPPVLAKTATTGWRMVRYYAGSRQYRKAGPPPMLLRMLGPLVVVSSLALLGSGIALVLLGEQQSRTALITVLGWRLDWVGLHQGAFAVWFTVMTVHVLARLVPALRLTVGPRISGRLGPALRPLLERVEHLHVPGGVWRGALLTGALAAALSGALWMHGIGPGDWGHHGFGDLHAFGTSPDAVPPAGH